MDTPGSLAPSVTRRHVSLAAVDNPSSKYAGSSFTTRLDAVSDAKSVAEHGGVSSTAPSNVSTLSRLGTGDSRQFIQRAEGIIESARAVRQAAEAAAAARAVRDDTLAGLIRVAFDGAPMPEQSSTPGSLASSAAAPRYLTALELVHAMAEAEAVASASAAGSPLPGWPLAAAGVGRPLQAPERSALSARSVSSAALSSFSARAGQHQQLPSSLPSLATASLPASAFTASSRFDAIASSEAAAAAAAVVYEAAAAATSSPHIRHLSSFARHGLGLGQPAGNRAASPVSGAAAASSASAPAAISPHGANTAAPSPQQRHSHAAVLMPAPPDAHGRWHHDPEAEFRAAAARSEHAMPPASPSQLRLAASTAASSASAAFASPSSSLGDGLGLRMHMSLADMTSSVDGLAEAQVRRREAAAHAGAGAAASPAQTQLHAAPSRRCICGAAASSGGEAAQAIPLRAAASPAAYAPAYTATAADAARSPPPPAPFLPGSSAHGWSGAAPASYRSPLGHSSASTGAGAGGLTFGSQPQLPHRLLRTASPAEPPYGSPLRSASPSSRHYASRQLASHVAVLSPSERDIRRVHAHIDESLTQLLRQLHSR